MMHIQIHGNFKYDVTKTRGGEGDTVSDTSSKARDYDFKVVFDKLKKSLGFAV